MACDVPCMGKASREQAMLATMAWLGDRPSLAWVWCIGLSLGMAIYPLSLFSRAWWAKQKRSLIDLGPKRKYKK